MKATPILDVLVIELNAFGGEHGFLFESSSRRKFTKMTGNDVDFVPDNHHRCSAKNVWCSLLGGFQRLQFLYKTIDYWAPEFERSSAWNKLAISSIQGTITSSARDQ
ncbi:dTDP-4-dehydrorhamnose 3,5-epimerase family protein [Uliginosibacterium gangwonense]|uniref:dTDP-4-dehydrorhamnose 3,5-epimerase family protein n=1 Tax=Uliginosibacterium gangwonense TaxID=392736 RepID=UPI0003805CDA|nr:dTDP-4-dehydrorhamnose 3,5-epimerase family protein [Uliginosibacterium gangwonense]